ncbi:unnamed protein product [Spirodela intermedia]|uniref:Protein transport protein sec16 n=1 Tax=Spirodela intermedia TaxID=51605 RepID=A0A7I8LNA8_SPIIN|nr:unnamed protein product [Spirodela intermedia]
MASTDPFQLEDQTDEDFFDKLVGDDEFGLEGSGSASSDMARALSNMSIGDVGTSVDGVKEEDQREDKSAVALEPQEKDTFLLEESAPVALSDIVALHESQSLPSSDPVKALTDVGSPGSSTGMSAGSKGTSIKEVQWTSFSSGQGLLDMGGSGSYSDFFSEVPDRSADQLVVGADNRNAFADVTTPFDRVETHDFQDFSVANSQPSYMTSSEQSEAQAHVVQNEQVSTGNESEYWENAYPGWKYDVNTGQWYQVDSYDITTSAQVDGNSSAVENDQEVIQGTTQLAYGNVFHGQRSEISYSQQTTQSVTETVSEDIATGNLPNLNQASKENTEYPPNMLFDPQYPGWYYDTNTSQWYSLDSYTQSLQTTSHAAWNQQAQDLADGLYSVQNSTLHSNETDQLESQTLNSQASQDQGDWGGYSSGYQQHSMWQPKEENKSESASGLSGSQTVSNFYRSQNQEWKLADQQIGLQTKEIVPSSLHSSSIGSNSFSTFVPAESSYQVSQPRTEHNQHADIPQNYFLHQNSVNYSQQFSQNESASNSQFPYVPNGGRSLEGRPPHALVTFGFGGKLIVMKDPVHFSTNLAYGSQDAGKGVICILNLAEVAMENPDSSAINSQSHDYFHILCRQPFPGPLVGGNASTKDLNKWIDERITSCESLTMDVRKGELLRLLLSLLKISCQYYGKLRSPFGTDPSLQETDSPELAITRLFASAKKNSHLLREYGDLTHCMHNLPSEAQIRTTAVEVQRLLVSGRRKEALQCAQEGQLWGPALVLAAQLGDKFYVETVKQMAHRQFVSGSPLRTLCLLIAGQPADVFSTDNSISTLAGVKNVPQQPTQISSNSMLDDWEENLAIITANRTKDDELVIINLGDCLWKETGEVTAAHTCYLVAEAKFESYSDKARLCLVGADHWRCPRTYASPEAIQRTELYEYSKVTGNSQFVLLPFQPYKLVYAYMLVEVGKVSDSLKYCQAIMKSLKSSGRDPEVETWKGMVSSLEERLRAHQQGGYGTNLAPAKLVGKLFTSIDRSLHRMIGAPPPSLPPLPPGHLNSHEHDNMSTTSKVGNIQSAMSMSSLVSSASVETISTGWTGDGRKTIHNRSVSEPDFGRSPKQEQVSPGTNASPTDGQNKGHGASRLGLFGSQFLQKTMGWMSKSRQAKLGESNKFYYDEKLKRWVEEGAEPLAEPAPPPAPPTAAAFQNHAPPAYGSTHALSTENLPPNGMLDTKAPSPPDYGSGVPPMPPSQNQFSARGRMGVRSRYVDTFNKGGGAPARSFQSPSLPSAKPAGGAKFFIPTPVAAADPADAPSQAVQGPPGNEDGSASVVEPASTFLSSASSSSSSTSSPSTMQRFPSMDNISSNRNKGMGSPPDGNGSLGSRTRAASWSGTYPEAFSQKPSPAVKPANGRSGAPVPSFFTPNNSPFSMNPAPGPLHANGSGFGDDLQEVEL